LLRGNGINLIIAQNHLFVKWEKGERKVEKWVKKHKEICEKAQQNLAI